MSGQQFSVGSVPSVVGTQSGTGRKRAFTAVANLSCQICAFTRICFVPYKICSTNMFLLVYDLFHDNVSVSPLSTCFLGKGLLLIDGSTSTWFFHNEVDAEGMT